MLIVLTLKLVQDTEILGLNIRLYNYYRLAKPGSRKVENIEFASSIAVMFSLCVLTAWIVFLIFLSGNVHPICSVSTLSTDTVFIPLNLTHNLPLLISRTD